MTNHVPRAGRCDRPRRGRAVLALLLAALAPTVVSAADAPPPAAAASPASGAAGAPAVAAPATAPVPVPKAARPSAPYARVLVVGITPDFDQRCRFEYALGTQLAGKQTTAVVSCDAMGSTVPLTRENVERVVRERRVDAVIATRLVGGALGAREGGTRDTRGDARYKATDARLENFYYGGYTVYGVPVTYGEFRTAPSLTSLTGEARVVTQVWSVAEGGLVEEFETQAKFQEGRDAVLTKIAVPIAKHLRRGRLVR